MLGHIVDRSERAIRWMRQRVPLRCAGKALEALTWQRFIGFAALRAADAGGRLHAKTFSDQIRLRKQSLDIASGTVDVML